MRTHLMQVEEDLRELQENDQKASTHIGRALETNILPSHVK